VTLSLRAWLVFFWLGCAVPAAPVWAEAPAAGTAPDSRAADAAARSLDAGAQEAVQTLSRRIERLLPVLMSSLAAARREREGELVRCFDRAVSELHSLRRQLAYHAQRRALANEPSERARHSRALTVLAQRVDELAHSGESCFTDGVWLPPGKTRVDVVFAPR
jgi:hypothetical protein